MTLRDVVDMVNTRMTSENGTEKTLMFEIHLLLLELEERRKNENKDTDRRTLGAESEPREG